MNRYVFNYSKILYKDSKIYSIGGQRISGGVSIKFLKIVVPIFITILSIGYIIAKALEINMFDFLSSGWNYGYLISWLVMASIVSYVLWGIYIGGYRMYQYILAYFKKKRIYTNSVISNEVEYTKSVIKLNGIFYESL